MFFKEFKRTENKTKENPWFLFSSYLLLMDTYSTQSGEGLGAEWKKRWRWAAATKSRKLTKNTKRDDSLSAMSLTLIADQRERSNIKNPEWECITG